MQLLATLQMMILKILKYVLSNNPNFIKKVIRSTEAIEQYYFDTGRCLQNVIDQFKLNDFWAENSQMYVGNCIMILYVRWFFVVICM